MNRALVSVVIPTFNGAKFIRHTLKSVFAQTYEHIEIIVVNDGSTDQTLPILTEYGTTVQVINQGNAGPNAARNAGVAKGTGEYVALLDSDDVWLPAKLLRQAEYLDSHRTIGLLGCTYYEIDEAGERTGQARRPPPSQTRESLCGELLIHSVPGVTSSTAMIRRECLTRAGVFDEGLRGAEDRDMWLRIAQHYDVAVLDEPLAEIRYHPRNTHKNTRLMKENQLRFIAKHFPQRVSLQKLRALSYVHVDAAQESFGAGAYMQALYNALGALLLYPRKTYPGDDKGRLVIKSMLGLLSVRRRFKAAEPRDRL